MKYEHKKIAEAVAGLGQVPVDNDAYQAWIQADAHLAFLRDNSYMDDLVVLASAPYVFVYSVVVPDQWLFPIDKAALLHWSCAPDNSVASYVSGGGGPDVWVERGLRSPNDKKVEGGLQLVFSRRFEGFKGPGRNYLEIHQEYAHLAEIHWRPEQKAYCRYDEHGDMNEVVSLTSADGIDLATFAWEPLEEYLAASKSSLVRRFDFTLLRYESFGGWSKEQAEDRQESEVFFYQQKIDPGASYTAGVQIIRPRRGEKVIFKDITDGWGGRKNKGYAEFTAWDWRNRLVSKISTDPDATSNYFNAEGNARPFELSPAFFRPEVLLKYKGDRDKYTIGERDISCRAAWYMKGIDINEAGQVHAYIVDLRNLPYAEQLHWQSFNEPPKTTISERAYVNDFQGEFVTFVQPLQRVLSIVRGWHEKKVAWWTLRNEGLLNRVNRPITASRDEWAEAFMDLAKLVIEGFETAPIRAKLDAEKVKYEKEERTIALLEKILNKTNNMKDQKLMGLRTVQNLRSKAKGHAGGGEAEDLAREALTEHESFTNHFDSVSGTVATELEAIENLFAK